MAKSLIRWHPASEMVSLRDAMDRLLGESFIRPWFGQGTLFGGEALALDMYETGDEVVVEATVPGVKPEEIDVQVTGNVLAAFAAQSRCPLRWTWTKPRPSSSMAC
jgi:HSP20 family protein